MTAYYNEIDPYAAQWLRNLIAAGLIPAGDVDERSIVDVRPADLACYVQCHFFAGIGGWSVALRLAGWPDSRPVWTGSCPCQPFSAAGAGKAGDDERHLWPAWLPLITECRPAIVFGEQVEAAIGWGWLDAVFSDLEGEGYACGAAVLPACGIGAPHIRQRLWFVADASRGGFGEQRHAPQPGCGGYADRSCDAGQLGGTSREGSGRDAGAIPSTQGEGESEWSRARGVAHEPVATGAVGELGDAQRGRRQGSLAGMGESCGAPCGQWRSQTDEPARPGPTNGFWSDAEWIACTDGKTRPVGPGSFPLGHGIQRRPSKLRAYGNAIVPQVAAEFIMAAALSPHQREGNNG